MFCTILQLASGTQTHLINLPLAGGWNGDVVYSMASSSDITVDELIAVTDGGSEGISERVVDDTFVIPADKRINWDLGSNESMIIVSYDCAAEVSFTIEARRFAQTYE